MGYVPTEGGEQLPPEDFGVYLVGPFKVREAFGGWGSPCAGLHCA